MQSGTRLYRRLQKIFQHGKTYRSRDTRDIFAIFLDQDFFIFHGKGQWLKITTNSRHKLEWIQCCGYNKKIPLDNFPLSGRPLLGSSGQHFMGGRSVVVTSY